MPSASSHVRGRNALAAAWPVVTGAAATLPELQIAGAMAALESGYGQAAYKNKLTGESRVINNWGAQQCGHGPPCGADCFEVSDTHADGTQYNFCYAVFPNTPDGDARAAEFFVKAVTTKRPYSWEAMKLGDIDEYTRRAGAKDPISGTGLYFEQKYEARASGLWNHVQAIASANGEPVSAVRGGPAITDGGGEGGTPGEASGAGTAIGVGIGAGLVALLAKWWFGRKR